MDIKLAERIILLEKEAIEIQDEIDAINYRVSNDNENLELLRVSNKRLEELTQELEENRKEMRKIAKDLKL